jgi:hypothetical protein
MPGCGSLDRNEYSDIDQAIAVQLKPLRDYLEEEGVLVRALPDMAATFGDRTDAGDLYFVLSSGQANNDDRDIFISETWQCTLVIMLPNRYTKSGVYDAFKRARSLLVGFLPPYCNKALGAPDWQFNRDQAHWVIQATFPFNVCVVDELIDPLDPSITEIRLATDYSGIIINAN